LGGDPGDPRYFTHVGRVVIIEWDGHARLSEDLTTAEKYLSAKAEIFRSLMTLRLFEANDYKLRICCAGMASKSTEGCVSSDKRQRTLTRHAARCMRLRHRKLVNM
jgi:hypothetical protein